MTRKNWRYTVLPYLAKAGILLIAMTCRVRWYGREEYQQSVDSGDAFILSMWHNCSTIAGWALRNSDVTVIVSDSRDGEYVSRMANLFGIKSIRGSSSSGSPKVIRESIGLLKNGHSIAITPDGPRGPRYKLQSGLLWFCASQKAPIIPLHIESSRQWKLKSWDGHRFPKPFSTIHISLGRPIHIDRNELEEDFETQQLIVERHMMDNLALVQKVIGNDIESTAKD